MFELKDIAVYAARQRIRGRSFKRNSLLKPLDFILGELERCLDLRKDKNNEDEFLNEIEFAKASSKGLIFDHIRRLPYPAKEQDVYTYVDLFFDDVLSKVHHQNVSKLLQRERSLRSAYLVYMRQELAKIIVERGKAKDANGAFQTMDAVEESQDQDEALV